MVVRGAWRVEGEAKKIGETDTCRRLQDHPQQLVSRERGLRLRVMRGGKGYVEHYGIFRCDGEVLTVLENPVSRGTVAVAVTEFGVEG